MADASRAVSRTFHADQWQLPPVQSKSEEQSVFCDYCNQPASFATGTYFTSSEFLTLLQKGLEPHRQAFTLLSQVGLSTEAFTTALPGEITLTYTTGWLLCPSCAPEANRILPKQAGNLPGGEPDAKGRERTIRDAGTGKMFFMVRAMATKALSGGATSTKQADYYIISILPPVPAAADREELSVRLLASAGYTKGIAEVQFVVATGGAASLSSFTDSLLVNYERAAKSAGKEVDLRRSQLHDFGGKGFPQGKLIAVFHTVPDTQNAATFYKMATEQRDAGAIRNLRSAAERGDAAAQYSNTRRVR